MECIGCAQCIDACAPVMAKLGRKTGLIRYSTQATMEGEKPHMVRPRVIIYPAIMLVVLTLFGVLLGTKKPADVLLLRSRGNPFTVMQDGHVANSMRIKITNRTDAPVNYTIQPADERITRIELAENPLLIGPGESRAEGVLVVASRSAFLTGSLDVHLRVSDGERFEQVIACRLLGPSGPVSSSVTTNTSRSAGDRP